MSNQTFSWRDPRFTYADALTGARLLLTPYVIYGVVRDLPDLATATLIFMIGTDLVDGTIARKLGQAREIGRTFDSVVDFLFIYSLFTTFFAVGVTPWWKWAVIFANGLLIAGVQVLYAVKAGDTVISPSWAGKKVGQIQFVYLLFLLARTFWLDQQWALPVDHIIFAVLAVAIAASAADYLGKLAQLLRRNGGDQGAGDQGPDARDQEPGTGNEGSLPPNQ